MVCLCVSVNVQREKVRDGEDDRGSSAASSDEEEAKDTSAIERVEGTLVTTGTHVTMGMAKMWTQRVAEVCP